MDSHSPAPSSALAHGCDIGAGYRDRGGLLEGCHGSYLYRIGAGL